MSTVLLHSMRSISFSTSTSHNSSSTSLPLSRCSFLGGVLPWKYIENSGWKVCKHVVTYAKFICSFIYPCIMPTMPHRMRHLELRGSLSTLLSSPSWKDDRMFPGLTSKKDFVADSSCPGNKRSRPQLLYSLSLKVSKPLDGRLLIYVLLVCLEGE